jgi:Protein of unknown function (DUF1761)
MDEILTSVNWTAVIAGTIASFGLGFLWFGPIFGKIWSAGSHGITVPSRMHLSTMALQLAGTFLLAWVIGATATINALVTAVFVILATAVLLTAGALFSQKPAAAAILEGGFVLAMGVLMIAAQGIF